MFGLLRRKPPLDEESVRWIFDVFAWSLRNLGSDDFAHRTRLVLPTAQDFPGKADSVQGMAALVFERVVAHAGMDNRHLRLTAPGAQATAPAEAIAIAYPPALVNDPEALIATFAHQLAHAAASQAAEPPPGGPENLPHLTELVGVFMGFGLMFANSAFKVPRGGCGACAADNAMRQGYLSQYDLTYALALFAILKDIRNREVLGHLKSPLRPFFKQAVKDIKDRAEALEKLQALLPAALSR